MYLSSIQDTYTEYLTQPLSCCYIVHRQLFTPLFDLSNLYLRRSQSPFQIKYVLFNLKPVNFFLKITERAATIQVSLVDFRSKLKSKQDTSQSIVILLLYRVRHSNVHPFTTLRGESWSAEPCKVQGPPPQTLQFQKLILPSYQKISDVQNTFPYTPEINILRFIIIFMKFYNISSVFDKSQVLIHKLVFFQKKFFFHFFPKNFFQKIFSLQWKFIIFETLIMKF